VAVILVVEPFLKSLKVLPFMEEANMSSEKVAVTFVVAATPVALAAETVLMTLGAVVSVVGGGGSGVGGRTSSAICSCVNRNTR
jgi:hypothetical protein